MKKFKEISYIPNINFYLLNPFFNFFSKKSTIFLFSFINKFKIIYIYIKFFIDFYSRSKKSYFTNSISDCKEKYNTINKENPNYLILSSFDEKNLAELKKNGIVVINDFINDDILSKISPQIDKNFKDMNVINSSYEGNQFPSTSFLNYEEAKSFLPNLILFNPYLNIQGLLNLTFNKRLLSLVSNFYGYIPTFSEPNIIRSFPPVLDGKMKEASFWHKDSNDDKNYLQLFLYLNNVDKYGGPFLYLRNSHKNSLKSYLPLYDLEKNYLENFGRVSDFEIKKFYKKEDVLELHGKAGTLIIADTTGFHRGPFWDLNNLQFLKERTLINISVTSGNRYLRINKKNKISPKVLEEDFLKLDSVQKEFYYNS